MNNKPVNVYEYENDRGEKRYSVCVWNQQTGQYTVPHDAEEQRLTGCYASFARQFQALGAMWSESNARYEARKRYGYSKKG